MKQGKSNSIQIAILHALYAMLFSGGIHGKDLLEVGCGPSILFSIVPSQYFKSLYLADYLKGNVEIIQTWLDDKPGQVDYQPFFDFAGKCIGRGYDII